MYDLSTHERDMVERAIREKFKKAADSVEGLFRYPTGEAGLRGLGYDETLVQALPKAVRDCYCGVGNPFFLGLPRPGDRVLDIGCGAGVDALLAGMMVGPSGAVCGVEDSPDMLARARKNALASGAANVSFSHGGAEALPFDDARFDLLLSNSVYNLVVDKDRALAEALRVLRPGGRLQFVDQVLTDSCVEMSRDEAVQNWFT